MNKPLRIALTKGRLEKETVALMERAGLDCRSLHDKGRRLILPLPEIHAEAVLAKAADVITYVESGVCDIGVVGKDTILENASSLYELLDLGFGRCRFALAVERGEDFFAGYGHKTIATKYPKIARSYFEKQSMDVSVDRWNWRPCWDWRTASWTLWRPARPCGKTAWRSPAGSAIFPPGWW